MTLQLCQVSWIFGNPSCSRGMNEIPCQFKSFRIPNQEIYIWKDIRSEALILENPYLQFNL